MKVFDLIVEQQGASLSNITVLSAFIVDDNNLYDFENKAVLSQTNVKEQINIEFLWLFQLKISYSVNAQIIFI